MKRRNNQGSTIVLVIVVLAIVGILATVSLWISLKNFQMKATDANVKNNFYSAESVYDQICVGLQGEISEAYKTAYLNTMQSFSNYDEDARMSKFKEEYLVSLRKQLSPADSDLLYDLSLLIGMVDKSLLDASMPGSTRTEAGGAVVSASSASEGDVNGTLETYTSKIVLKGLKVTYVDTKGYQSIIESDIVIDVPTLMMTSYQALPDVFSYSIIANSGIEFGNDTSHTTYIKGNVYAGSRSLVDPIGAPNEKTSMKLGLSKVEFSDASYVIAHGDVSIAEESPGTSNSGSYFCIENGIEFWTNNLTAKSATVVLKGRGAFFADDLSLTGYAPSVTLYNNYLGFGDSTGGAAGSSSIILNGKECTLDMSMLNDLTIAGFAHVGTGKVSMTSEADDALHAGAEKDVLMGESIAVKGDQIAYLIPAECIGTDGNTSTSKSKYGRNPLTYDEYKDIKNNSSTYTLVNPYIVSSKTKKPLSDYLNGSDINNAVKLVFVPDKKLVYFYISFSQSEGLTNIKEVQYFNDFYDVDIANAEKLKLYTDFYSDKIIYNTHEDGSIATKIATRGTYPSFDGTNYEVHSGTVVNFGAITNAAKQKYTALTTILSSDSSEIKTGQEGKTVYTNVINEIRLAEIFSNTKLCMGNKAVFTYNGAGGQILKVVASKDDYVFDTTEKNSGVAMVVCEGNVEIKDDFTGVIIAKGKITIDPGCKISNATSLNIKRLLAAKDESGTEGDADYVCANAYELFDQGSAYLTASIGSNNSVGSEEALVEYGDLVHFQNWTKK